MEMEKEMLTKGPPRETDAKHSLKSRWKTRLGKHTGVWKLIFHFLL